MSRPALPNQYWRSPRRGIHASNCDRAPATRREALKDFPIDRLLCGEENGELVFKADWVDSLEPMGVSAM